MDCGWQPQLLIDFRRLGLGEPPIQRLLEELAQALNFGERHLHADHDIPIAVRPDLRLNLDNLKTRCDKCHNRKTMNALRGSAQAKG